MAQRITTSFVNTNRPGSYLDIKVKSTPVGVASSGNIAILGEATGGGATKGVDSTNGTLLKDNFFTPDQLSRIESQYISGPIVDAARAISSPSSDANITGSANRIYIAKTNQGTRASATVATAYGTLQDKNWGVDGNKYKYQITQSIDESGPAHESGVIPAFGAALDSAEFTVRLDGGAEATVTLGVGGHADRDALVTELDGLLPSGLGCVAGTAANTIRIEADTDAAANSKGFGKTFELIDSTPGDLAALGLTGGLYSSSAEPEVQVDINRQDTGVNEQFLVKAEVALKIGYQGTTGTVDIDDDTLSTTVTGGSGANLSLNIKEFNTLTDLAEHINSQTGYTASVESTSSQTPSTALDNVTGVGICSTNSTLEPGRVKKGNQNFKDQIAQSRVLNFNGTASAGLPSVMATATFLTGGTKGATTAANVVSAITDLETVDVNFVIPLFSRDATSDISDGLTDSSSTYTIDAVNAAVKSHILKVSTSEIKKNRLAFCSFWGTFADAQSKAGTLANARVSLAMQRTSQVNSTGVVVNHLPWHTASIAAGMQAAGFYRSITNKFANVISFEDPSGFDSGSHGDIETAIDSGLLFLEKTTVGSKWVVDQTTYGVDTNFVFNSIQAMYSADLVALDLTASFQTAFVGQSLADVDASTALSFLASKMDSYKKQKLIAASDDAPLGFRNAKVSINGPIMEVSVEIKLATAILFIPISIEISQVQSVA